MLCSCRLLGVEHAATFEEVQDARNYLYEVSKHMRQKFHDQAYVHILRLAVRLQYTIMQQSLIVNTFMIVT